MAKLSPEARAWLEAFKAVIYLDSSIYLDASHCLLIGGSGGGMHDPSSIA